MRNKETARIYNKVYQIYSDYTFKEADIDKKMQEADTSFIRWMQLITDKARYQEVQKVLGEVLKEIELAQEGAIEEAQEKREGEWMDVLDLNAKIYNSLKHADKHIVKDLTEMTYDELLAIRNIGKKDIAIIEEKLGQIGLFLRIG